MAVQVLRITGLLFAWMVQYCLFVPCVYGWRMIAAAFKLGALGLLLLCIPVLGWVVLAVMLVGRPGSAHRSNIWRPWGLRRR